MNNKVIISKNFAKNLEIYSQNKKSLTFKILDLKNHLEDYWFWFRFF